MGTWLTLAGRLFDSMPMLAQRHAILLTDGENHNETPEQLTARHRQGDRQVPVRLPRRRRRLAGRRGTPDRHGAARHASTSSPTPRRWPQVFAEMMQQSMGRGVADAQLRVWAPQGAQVLFVRQVSPTVEDLTVAAASR